MWSLHPAAGQKTSFIKNKIVRSEKYAKLRHEAKRDKKKARKVSDASLAGVTYWLTLEHQTYDMNLCLWCAELLALLHYCRPPMRTGLLAST